MGGAIKNDTSHPTIIACTFDKNISWTSTGSHPSGGAIDNEEGDPTCVGCVFRENEAGYGGAIGNWMGWCDPAFINCIFIQNTALYGGVLWASNNFDTSNPEFINCTLADNSATYGNAVACEKYSEEVINPSTVEITNCILWDGGDEIWSNDGSIITVSYSDIQSGWLGVGNIDAEPSFADPCDGDYHLLSGSPCVDAGDPNYAAGPGETDLDGKYRVIGGRVDMGAYEFNHLSVACIVGGDRAVEAGEDCEGRVVLDGSCSSDEDSTAGTNDDINDFDWYEVIDACEPNSDIYLGSGEVLECNLGLGEHLIILEVTDKAGTFDSNEVVITVEDVTPPELSVVVEPNVLWPPNGKMVEVRPEWEASDNCDEQVQVSLVDISMSEGGDVNDYVAIEDDGSIYLRAAKSKRGGGRIYTLTYQAVDDSGNVTEASATVTVPHSRKVWRLGRGLVRWPGRRIYRRKLQHR